MKINELTGMFLKDSPHSKHKRIALEKAYENINPDEKPIWEDNENLISWLKRF